MKSFEEIRKRAIESTRKAIRASVERDQFIVQCINNISDIDRSANMLVKRLREWYSLYFPELAHRVDSHESFVALMLKKNREELMRDLSLKTTMGADISRNDMGPIIGLAEQCKSLFELRKKQEDYLKRTMEELCPSLLALAGTLIGAKLIAHAGSLKRLSEMPSSTIQLLGAEKALFRHLTTNAKAPKYGVIINHPFVQNAAKQDKGKAARHLANKISIAVKADFFHGEFIGDKLKMDLEAKSR